MKYFVMFLAGVGGVTLCIGLVLLAMLMKIKISDCLADWKIKRKRKLFSKHQVKIPLYCCECEKWGGAKEVNKHGCPMANYVTGEFDYCSRGTKEK